MSEEYGVALFHYLLEQTEEHSYKRASSLPTQNRTSDFCNEEVPADMLGNCMYSITTFRPTTGRIYDGGPIIL
jgi:hypothetical protein